MKPRAVFLRVRTPCIAPGLINYHAAWTLPGHGRSSSSSRLITPSYLRKTSMSAKPSSEHWLSNCLCDLMACPHVSVPSHMGGIHTSPGPIDLFSTRFNTYFMPEARGMLAGRSVDREELKAGLLALQRTWDSENVKVMEPKHHSRGMMSTEMEWTPEGSTMPEVVSAEASVGQESGHKQIRFLKVEGNPALFRV